MNHRHHVYDMNAKNRARRGLGRGDDIFEWALLCYVAIQNNHNSHSRMQAGGRAGGVGIEDWKDRLIDHRMVSHQIHTNEVTPDGMGKGRKFRRQSRKHPTDDDPII